MADPSVVLVRITNTGRATIKIDDFQNTLLKLEFAGRRVVDAKVIEANDSLRTELQRQTDWPPPNQTELQLPIAALNPGDRIKVLVLLTGTPNPAAHRVSCDGFVAGGRIVRDTTRGNGPRTRTVVIGGIALVAVGASVAVLLSPAEQSPAPTNCVAGEVRLVGSSAFAPIADEVMRSYKNNCASANVSVQERGSEDALVDLDIKGKNDPTVRQTQVAMSDGLAQGNYPALRKHPVGVVAFAVVVNKATGRYTLTEDQIRGIYTGAYTNWSQLGGANLPISIISRGAGSGTRLAFETKVLKMSELVRSSSDCVGHDLVPTAPVIRCVSRIKLDGREPDVDSVIRTGYPFWTVEYFYTYGEPSPAGLIRSLLAYMDSDTAKNILRREGYVPCVDGPQDLTGTLCR